MTLSKHGSRVRCSKIKPVIVGDEQVTDVTMLDPDLEEKLWTPRLFMHNLKSTKKKYFMTEQDGSRMYIWKRGQKYWVGQAQLFVLKLHCKMDFRAYPMDTQVNYFLNGH